MGPYVDAVPGDIDLPAKTDVVIIGGGIIGVSAALELARRGIAVTLCEKGYIACEQSSRNWGWCRQAGRDEREMPLIVDAMRRWRAMDRQTGRPVGYRECGTLYIGETEKDIRDFESWMAMAAPYETGACLMTGAAFEERAKMPAKGRVGLFVPSDGCAEPQMATPALAHAARAAGATLLAPCAVRGIERSGGRVSAVVTERGRIDCQAVLIAAGAWSSLLCRMLGFSLPQLKIAGTVLRTSRVENGPESCTWFGRLGYRRRQDGGYTIADGSTYPTPIVPDALRFLPSFWPMIRQEWRGARPYLGWETLREFFAHRPAAERPGIFERERVREPQPDRAMARQALAAMADIYPAFASAQIVQSWACYMDASPDAIPYIDALPGQSDVVVATGFSGHGFGIGPAAGAFAASLICGDKPDWDHSTMRLTRFADGSPITLGAEV